MAARGTAGEFGAMIGPRKTNAGNNLKLLGNLRTNGTTISSYNYAHDAVGNKTRCLESDLTRVTWTYDKTYQLANEKRNGPATTITWNSTYTYDPAGNRLVKNADGTRTTSTYDAANQLNWSQTGAARTTYAYDAAGSQSVEATPANARTSLTWDHENMATLIRLPSGVCNTMLYDPYLRRFQLDQSSGTTRFIWDRQNIAQETSAAGTTQTTYTLEPMIYGNILSQRRSQASSCFHFDAVGSTRQLTSATATNIDDYIYRGFGEIVAFIGASSNPFQFIGQTQYYRHSDHEYLLVRARTLSSKLARWLSKEPLANSRFLGNYVYANSSPLQYTDPSGLYAMLIGLLERLSHSLRPETTDQLTLYRSRQLYSTVRGAPSASVFDDPLSDVECAFKAIWAASAGGICGFLFVGSFIWPWAWVAAVCSCCSMIQAIIDVIARCTKDLTATQRRRLIQVPVHGLKLRGDGGVGWREE